MAETFGFEKVGGASLATPDPAAAARESVAMA